MGVLQPCDVGLFRPLKANWNKRVTKYTCDNSGLWGNRLHAAAAVTTAATKKKEKKEGQEYYRCQIV